MNSNIPAQKNQPETTPISQSDWMPRHFDFNGTEKPVRFDEIIVDPAYQMRTEGTNPEVVKRYAEIMKQNDPDGWLAFPLIKLLRRKDADSKLFLISGFHRLKAMKLNGYDKIEAVVSRGTHLNGLILAAGENADRSQPRTNADIQNIVEMFLADPELCQWSNAQIARWAQVDAQTVANHERRLLSTPNFDIDNRPATRKFIDKHGNVSLRKASTVPSPDPQPAVDFDTYIGCRDKAFKAWKAYSPKWGIHGNWVELCQHIELEVGREGCLSLVNPDTATPEQLKDCFEAWDNVCAAINEEHASVLSFPPIVRQRDAVRAEAAAEEGPDVQGLKEAIYDLLDNGDQIYAPELAHTYSVPLNDVESTIAQATADVEMEAAEKRKESLMNEYDDLSSEVQHSWSKHLKRGINWDGLFAAAQSHWMGLENSHDYSPTDESEEALKLQIAIWKNFKADLEYAINGESERGEIWLSTLLGFKPESDPSETSKEKEVTIAPADLSALHQVLHNILGRDSLISEVSEILELISTFKNEGGAR